MYVPSFLKEIVIFMTKMSFFEQNSHFCVENNHLLEPHLKDIPVIWTPLNCGHFSSVTNKILHILIKKIPNTKDTPQFRTNDTRNSPFYKNHPIIKDSLLLLYL